MNLKICSFKSEAHYNHFFQTLGQENENSENLLTIQYYLHINANKNENLFKVLGIRWGEDNVLRML